MRYLGRIGLIMAVLLVGGVGYVAGTAHVLTPQRAVAADECYTFTQTGKQVCGRFLEYWRDNGGLAQQGLALSDPFQERNEINGQTYTVQYFERAVFEAHPENQRPYDVLLSLVGREKFLAKYPSGNPGAPPAATPTPTPTPPPAPQSIIGQVFDFPAAFDKTPLRGTVVDFKDNVSLSSDGKSLTPQGRFVAVFISVANLGNVKAEAGSYGFVLADGRGRQYSLPDTLAPQFAAGDLYKRHILYSDIQPSLSDEEVFVFDVATDATNFRMVGDKP